MAKRELDGPKSDIDTQAVAQSLFVSSWRPRSGVDAWMVAVECYRAASEFSRVSDRIAAGLSADDVIAEQQLADEQRSIELAAEQRRKEQAAKKDNKQESVAAAN